MKFKILMVLYLELYGLIWCNYAEFDKATCGQHQLEYAYTSPSFNGYCMFSRRIKVRVDGLE